MKLNDLPEINSVGEDCPEVLKRAAAVSASGRRAASVPGAAPVSGAPRHAKRAGGVSCFDSAVAGGGMPPAPPSIVAPPARRRRRSAVVAVAACVLVLAGAGVAAASLLSGREEVPVPAAVPATEAEAETVRATVKVDGLLVPGPVLQRGDELTNVVAADDLSGAYADAYYKAVYGGEVVYVEKSLVRTSNEAAPEQWVGYAAADAIIFAKSDLSGENILTLSLNEEVTVLDAFGDLLFVRNADGFEGYVPADKIMREKVEEPEAEAGYAASPSGSSGYAGGSSGSGSGSSGGGSGSGGSGSGSGGSADGGGSGSGSGGGSNSGSGGSADGGSSSDGSGSSGGGTPPTSGDGDEMVLPTNFMEGFDLFRLGVGVAYADEPADAVVADAAATHAVGAADAAGSADAAGAVPESDVTAVVLASDVQTYEGMFNRGDEVVVKLGADTAADGADAAGGSAGASDGVSGGDALSDASASTADADEGASPTAETGGPSGEAGIWDDAPELSAEEKAEKGAEVDAEPTCTVLLNGREVSLPAKLLRLETDDPYQPWSGFALEGACLFEDYQLTRQSAQLAPGDELAVIDAAGSVLIVERDGALFYIDESLVGTEPAGESEPSDAADAPVDSQGSSPAPSSGSGSGNGWSSSSGGASGSGSGSGAGSGGSSGPAPSTGGGSTSGGSDGSGSSGSSGGSSGGESGGADTGTEGGDSGDAEWTPPKL